MSLDVSKVLVGAPDQMTTGAILDAPVGTALPTSAVDTLNDGFKSSGYVSEDGVEITPERSTNDIKDWSGNTVRELLDSFKGTITWTEIQMDYDALRHAFGVENVKQTAADKDHGTQTKTVINAEMPEARSWVFKMKDGKSRMLIVVPNGQVTSVGTISLKSSSAVGLQLTLSCAPDADGNNIYIYTDDGKVAAA